MGPNTQHSGHTESVRSGQSQVTLVEKHPDLMTINEMKPHDGFGVVSSPMPNYTWLDHLLGVFCVKSSKKTQTTYKEPFVQSRTFESAEVRNSPSLWLSPYILPVYVELNNQDTEKHPITKVAKCIIDTGNMQGNIVSREFVQKVLEFPESTFLKLTKEEERGGTSITGDSHIPLGAINLTWYHKNSTRVFYDMRFLISPTQHCDLIIGAQSIQKDNILNVPCLMVDKDERIFPVPTGPPPPETATTKLDKLYTARNSTLITTNLEIERLGGRNPGGRLDALKKNRTRLEKETKVLNWTRQLYDIAHGKMEGDKQKQDKLWTAIGNPELKYDKENDAEMAEVWKVVDPMLEQLWTKLGNKEKYYGSSTTFTSSSDV